MLLPVGHGQGLKRWPWLTFGLIGVNFVCLALTAIALVFVPVDTLTDLLAFKPSRFLPWTLLTSLFLHAGIGHLLGNMLFLYLAGPPFEDRYGRWGLLLLYLSGGVFASLFYAVFHWGAQTPLVGASGAISSLLGMALVRFPNIRIRFYFTFMFVFWWPFEVRAWIMLPLWLALQVTFALLAEGQGAGVAFSAHIGGFLFGVAAALAIKRLGLEDRLTPEEVKDADNWYQPLFKPDERLILVEDLLNVNRVAEASREIAAYLSENPHTPEALGLHTRVLLDQGRDGAALQQARRTISGLLLAENPDGALGFLRKLRDGGYDPDLGPLPYFKLASQLKARTDYHHAVEYYLESVRVAPGSSLAAKALLAAAGICKDKLRDGPRAKKFYDELLRKHPSSPQADAVRSMLVEM
ncbi:MAG: rhomboid family intramembrane serine protease [Candidatus Alcyoniella australis]|nr:rhomboid family intramembrane serine protease [Candidatus Alcyoniella australis]